MKKLTKILSLLLVCIIVLNIGVLAADNAADTETTEALTEVTTTLPEESTTEETTTTQQTEESTTAAEETSTEIAEESTTAVEDTTTTATEESTTAGEETTTEASEESTTAPEETTTHLQEESTTAGEVTTIAPTEEDTTAGSGDTETTQPTEPDVTDPTEPEKPDVTLPEAPAKVEQGTYSYGRARIDWDKVESADGYDVYIKKGDEWVFVDGGDIKYYVFEDMLYNSKYEVGVKSYITVEGEKYLSENMTTATIVTPTEMPVTSFSGGSSFRNKISIYWNMDGGASGYRIYIRKNSKWVKLEDVYDTGIYDFENALPGKAYKFGIKAFAKGTEGTVYSSLKTITITCEDYSETYLKASTLTSSSITVKWDKVIGASSYRVYIYKNGKWSYYKGITKTSYKITGLEASTKYKIKVKPCFKADGEVVWGSYSNTVSATTKGKTVKAFRVGQLKKYFTDGDWSVKVTGLKDQGYGSFDYTIAVKGNKAFVRYDFKNNNVNDFEYLIDVDKETAYVIYDANKTYILLNDDDAFAVAYSAALMAAVLDMSTAKGVTAKTTVYSGKTAVAEIYTDKDLDAKKTYYFINDKIKALKITYSDGSSETLKISSINDTPSSSVFSIPKGYKKVSY